MKNRLLQALTVIILALQIKTALASPATLAIAEPDLDGDGVTERAELRGEAQQGGYYTNLTLRVLDADGSVKALLVPDVGGSYASFLSCVSASLLSPCAADSAGKKNTETIAGNPDTDENAKGADANEAQRDLLLLAASQGAAGGTVEFRIYDFADLKRPRTVFNAANSGGLAGSASYLPQREYELRYVMPNEMRLEIGRTTEQDELKIYDADGNVAKKYLRPRLSRLTSLTVDEDFMLYTRQKILDADGANEMGVLDAAWYYDGAQWTPVYAGLHTYDTDMDAGLRRERVNAAVEEENYRVLPLGCAVSDAEGTRENNYPIVLLKENPEVQNKINDVLSSAVYLLPQDGESAYKVEFAGTNLLSLRLYSQKDGVIVSGAYNFDLKTGEDLSVENAFDTGDKDFLPLINLVGVPKDRARCYPTGWYCTGKTFVFEFPSEHADEGAGAEEVEVLATDFYKFLSDKHLPAEK